MDDSLYEIDVMNLAVGRTLHLTKDDELPTRVNDDDGHNMAVVKPTWVQPHPTKPLVYVALQGVDQIAEVSLEDWKITRRFHTQKGPYNLAITPNGKMIIATCKPNNSTAIWDLGKPWLLHRIISVATDCRLFGIAVIAHFAYLLES